MSIHEDRTWQSMTTPASIAQTSMSSGIVIDHLQPFAGKTGAVLICHLSRDPEWVWMQIRPLYVWYEGPHCQIQADIGMLFSAQEAKQTKTIQDRSMHSQGSQCFGPPQNGHGIPGNKITSLNRRCLEMNDCWLLQDWLSTTRQLLRLLLGLHLGRLRWHATLIWIKMIKIESSSNACPFGTGLLYTDIRMQQTPRDSS